MDQVAVIGTGNIGSRVIRRLAQGGVPLVVASSSIESARKAVEEFAPTAKAMETDDAIAAADIIVFATRFTDTRDMLTEKAELLEGKIVADPSNNIAPGPDGGLVDLNDDGTSAAQKLVPLLRPIDLLRQGVRHNVGTRAGRDPGS